MSNKYSFPSQKSYGATSNTNVEVAFSNAGNKLQIDSLSDTINSNIVAINSSIKLLRSLRVKITTQYSPDNVKKLEQIQSSTSEIISKTTDDLKQLSSVAKCGNKMQRLSVDKMTSHFKEIVDEYSSLSKDTLDKLKTKQKEAVYEEDHDDGHDKDEELQRQKMITREVEFETGLMVERHQSIRNIEEKMLIISHSMKEVGSLIQAQSEPIYSIEQNISDSQDRTESGVRYLESAERLQTTRRKRTLCLLGISFFIGVILLLVIVFTLKD